MLPSKLKMQTKSKGDWHVLATNSNQRRSIDWLVPIFLRNTHKTRLRDQGQQTKVSVLPATAAVPLISHNLGPWYGFLIYPRGQMMGTSSCSEGEFCRAQHLGSHLHISFFWSSSSYLWSYRLSFLFVSLHMLLSSSSCSLSQYHLIRGFGRHSLWAFSPDPCTTTAV